MRHPFSVIENPEKLQFIRNNGRKRCNSIWNNGRKSCNSIWNNRLNSCILELGLHEVFEGSIDADSIFRRISLVKEDARFVPGETLLFLAEIQW